MRNRFCAFVIILFFALFYFKRRLTSKGCGLHVRQALETVTMRDRCEFWKLGRHPSLVSVSKEVSSESVTEHRSSEGSASKTHIDSSFDVSVLPSANLITLMF